MKTWVMNLKKKSKQQKQFYCRYLLSDVDNPYLRVSLFMAKRGISVISLSSGAIDVWREKQKTYEWLSARKGAPSFPFHGRTPKGLSGVSQNWFLNGPTYKLKGTLPTSLPKPFWHCKLVISVAAKSAFVTPNITLLKLQHTPMRYTSCNCHVILWYCGKKTEDADASLA